MLVFGHYCNVLDFNNPFALILNDTLPDGYSTIIDYKHHTVGQIAVNHIFLLISKKKQRKKPLLISMYLLYYHNPLLLLNFCHPCRSSTGICSQA